MTTGEILTALREERNIKQRELAAYLNVSPGTISNYEHGVHSPDPTMLSRLADYFGVTTDFMLGRTSQRFDPKYLNRPISTEYTVTDLVNTVLSFDSCTVDKLMEYAAFLQSRKQ